MPGDKGEPGRARRHRVEMPRHANGHDAKASIRDVLRAGRGIPRKLRHEMSRRPELTLVAVSGAAFFAGAVLGSRIGRAVIAALVPVGIERLMESEVGPKLWDYVLELVEGAANTNGRGEEPS